MLEELFLTKGLGLLDLIFHTWFETIPIVSITTHLNEYLPILRGIMSDVFYFLPRSIFLVFIGYIVGFMLVRIILSIVNLIWW